MFDREWHCGHRVFPMGDGWTSSQKHENENREFRLQGIIVNRRNMLPVDSLRGVVLTFHFKYLQLRFESF